MQTFSPPQNTPMGQPPIDQPVEVVDEPINEVPGDINEDVPESPYSDNFKNLAEDLDEEELQRIANECIDGYENDLGTLYQVFQIRSEVNKLFSLFFERKTTPWDGACNAMLPMITTAVYNFVARAFPNIIGPNKIVKSLPIGGDAETFKRAKRVETHMDFQITVQMVEFATEFINMLTSLAKDGYAFRKIFFDPILKRPVSESLLPEDFIVNYWCTDLEKSYRYTHVLYKNINEIREYMDAGIFIKDDEIIAATTTESNELKQKRMQYNFMEEPSADFTMPNTILEQHTYSILKRKSKKDEGIRKPYCIWVDKESRKVLRVISRMDEKTGKPIRYFSSYTFLPNPGSLYGHGFGLLLLSINSVANTNICQLTDKATLKNNGGGLIAKGSGLSRGNVSFTMGEYKEVNVRGEDISKSIYTPDFGEPSSVLMSLVQFLQQYVDRLTTVTEVFTGGTPRSDTSATATQAAVDLGSKMFTFIVSKIHSDFKRGDLAILFDLNRRHLSEEEYPYKTTANFQGQETTQYIKASDYSDDLLVVPVSDPNIISQYQKVQKAEYLTQTIMQNPFLAQDPEMIALSTKERLEAVDTPPFIVDAVLSKMNLIVEQVNAQNQAQQQQDALMQQAAQEGYAKGANDATLGAEIINQRENSKRGASKE